VTLAVQGLDQRILGTVFGLVQVAQQLGRCADQAAAFDAPDVGGQLRRSHHSFSEMVPMMA
jgi:hypothetical protein